MEEIRGVFWDPQIKETLFFWKGKKTRVFQLFELSALMDRAQLIDEVVIVVGIQAKEQI